jgi:hypothetical protein
MKRQEAFVPASPQLYVGLADTEARRECGLPGPVALDGQGTDDP